MPTHSLSEYKWVSSLLLYAIPIKHQSARIIIPTAEEEKRLAPTIIRCIEDTQGSFLELVLQVTLRPYLAVHALVNGFRPRGEGVGAGRIGEKHGTVGTLVRSANALISFTVASLHLGSYALLDTFLFTGTPYLETCCGCVYNQARKLSHGPFLRVDHAPAALSHSIPLIERLRWRRE